MAEPRHRAGDAGFAFKPGYEPSAPPAPPGLGGRQQGTDFFLGAEYPPEEFRRGAGPGRGPLLEQEETVGQRIVGVLAGVARGLWRTSHTVLRLELRRGVGFGYAPPVSRLQPGRTIADQPGATVSTGGPLYGGQTEGFSDREWQGAGKLLQGGGRVKLMQVWDFTDQAEEKVREEVLVLGNGGGDGKGAVEGAGEGLEVGSRQRRMRFPWRVNLGLGASVEMEKGMLEPRLRVRGDHVALHLLPEPLLEFRGKWPVLNTQLAVDVRYRVPLLGLHRFWEDSGARLMVNLFNPLGTGVHLTPGGLEFDEHVLQVGKYTMIRVAASVDFPRQFPLPEGEQPVKVRINRLGLKTRVL